MKPEEDILDAIKESFGLNLEFTEKLLRIEELTMHAKNPNIDSRYECIPEERLDGYNPTIAFQLKTLIFSLSKEEENIVRNYLKDDYWCPGYWSAGGY